MGQTCVQTQAAPKKQTLGVSSALPSTPQQLPRVIPMDIPPPWPVTLVQRWLPHHPVTFTPVTFLSHTNPSWYHLPFPALLFPLERPCCRSLLGSIFLCHTELEPCSCRTCPHPWGHSGPSTHKFLRAEASPGSCRAHPWASAPPSEIAKGRNSSFSSLLRESQPPRPWQCSGSDLVQRFPAHGKRARTRS